MKRSVNYLFVVISALVLISCNNGGTFDAQYEVTHFSKDSIPVLKIKTIIKANASGNTKLHFQDDAWGETNLYSCIRAFNVIDDTAEVLMKPDSNQIIIKHSKKLKELVFEYELKQDTEFPTNSKNTYRPIIQPGYFSVFSHNLFIIPEPDNDTQDLSVKITWHNYTKNFIIHNSFDTQLKNQEITTTVDKFQSAVFIGGDFRIHSFDIKGNKVHFATRGEWKVFKDSTLVNLLKETIKAQRNFWNDHSQKYFTISMLPFSLKNGSSIQGSGLTNSFAISASNNEFIDIEGMAYLFNHELLHNWIGHTIEKANEEEQYWFSEGFTDYYTYKNIASNAILGLDKKIFIDKINEIAANLHASIVREAPNSAINYKNFWSDRGYEKLPYRRGALFAFYLDNKIHKDSKGEKNLDDLMLQFLKDAREKGQKIDHPYFLETVNLFLKDDLTSFFDTHIENGKLLDLKAFFDEFGYDYNIGINTYNRGFKMDSKKIISEVDPASNAYKAGMRQGDQVIGLDVYSDPNKEATVVVKRKEERLTFNFFPVKKIDLPKLLINEKNRNTLPF